MTWKKVLKFKPKENRLHLIPPEDLQELTSKVIDVSLEFGEKILDLVQEHFESGEELKIIATKGSTRIGVSVRSPRIKSIYANVDKIRDVMTTSKGKHYDHYLYFDILEKYFREQGRFVEREHKDIIRVKAH